MEVEKRKYDEKGNYKSMDIKKLNKSLVRRTHPLTTSSNETSLIIDKRLCNYVALIQNNVIHMENDVTTGPTDYCEFSYYRFYFTFNLSLSPYFNCNYLLFTFFLNFKHTLFN